MTLSQARGRTSIAFSLNLHSNSAQVAIAFISSCSGNIYRLPSISSSDVQARRLPLFSALANNPNPASPLQAHLPIQTHAGRPMATCMLTPEPSYTGGHLGGPSWIPLASTTPRTSSTSPVLSFSSSAARNQPPLSRTPNFQPQSQIESQASLLAADGNITWISPTFEPDVHTATPLNSVKHGAIRVERWPIHGSRKNPMGSTSFLCV